MEQIKIKIEATLPLTQKQETSSMPALCSSGCGGNCGGCGKSRVPLVDAGEKLLELAAGKYSLEQLSTALGIIETLLKKHYGGK